MGEVAVHGLDGKQVGEVSLGKVFSEKVRPDLINKCFDAERSEKRQPYGSNPLAGKRTSAHYHGERGLRYSMMNKEMARLKRIHNQGPLNMTARFSPQAIKGRRAHPPKIEKVWFLKVNKKERFKAIRSAIAATAFKDAIISRGHKADGLKAFPIVVSNDFEKIDTAKRVSEVLLSLGLEQELERGKEKKVRAGRGKMRGRRYKKKTSILIVASDLKNVKKAASNLAGIDVSEPSKLTVSLLAPGGSPGRLTVWTKSALEEVNKWV